MSRRRPAPIHPDSLKEQCGSLSCPVPPAALPALGAYLELLMQWNAVMNLVGTRNWRDTLHSLVADSFHLAAFLETLNLPAAPRTWDLGAGAGLPGLPLRMVWQKGSYTLVEAREKRALFLGTALARTPLPGTTVFQGRAEDFFPRAGALADMVISRAFMPWQQVLELVPAHMAPGGRVVFLALAPPPEPPAGWRVEAAREYAAGGGRRWFWALRRDTPEA